MEFSLCFSRDDLLDGERLLLVESPEVKQCLVTHSSSTDSGYQVHLSTKQKGEIEIDICSW